jgi:hypothetical protein
MLNMNIFLPKLNLVVNGTKYQVDLEISKKSKYLDGIVNRNTFMGVEVKKDKNLDVELKPDFFYDKSINVIINYFKTNKFTFDSNSFELFMDVVLCAQYLQINTLILDMRSFFLNILNNLHNYFSLNTDNSDINNNLECSIMDSDIIQINKLVKDIRQRRLMKPVHDDSIRKCSQCNTTFTTYLRKHHCRACGRIFCYKCSSKQIEIPEEEKTLLPDDNWFYSDLLYYFSSSEKVRVCDKCYLELDEQKKFSKISQCFQYMYLDIMTLKSIANVNYEWKKGSLFCLSLIRELQYRLPTKEYLQNERVLLWMNREYFSGHSKWIYQILRVVDWNNEYIYTEILNILNDKKKYECAEIFCTKSCSSQIDYIDILYLLKQHWLNSDLNNPIVDYLIDKFQGINDELFILILPYYIEVIKYSKRLVEILFDKCNDSYIFYQTYLMLNFNNKNSEYEIIKQNLLFKKTQENKEEVNNILSTINLISVLDMANQKYDHENNINIYINYLRYVGTKYFLPFRKPHNIIKILYDDISIKQSYTKPKFIPYIDNENNKKAILFKHEDIRKDLIIMNLIKYTKILLNKEGIDIPIITYDIIPINRNTGIIEIVNNCSNLFEITNKTSLNTYLIKHNQDKQIGNLNETFMKSLAYWTIITYLFGIGDRHLENIMITNDGVLFHIDFSFILGQEAKILVPYIRMSEELIEVMGGRDGKYGEFKSLCSKIFMSLRKYYIQFSELFLLLLSFHIPIEYLNLKQSYIENQIITRFLPGLSDKEAAHIIDDLIENSCDTFGQKMSDYLHYYYKKTSVINNGSPGNVNNLISKLDISKMNIGKWFW